MPAVIKSQKIGAGRGAKGAKYGKKKTSNYKRDVPVQEPVVEEDYDDEQYEIESIINHGVHNKRLEYHVTWVGYPGEETWVPEEDMAANEMLESYWKGVDIKRQHERFPPHSEEWRQAKAAAKKAAAEAADSEPKLSSGKKRRSMAEDGAKTASSKASPSRDKSAKTKSNGAATSSQSEKGAKRARSPEDVSSSHKKKKARARVPETESADEVALPNEHGDSDDDEFVDVNEQASEQSLTAARNLNGELEDDEDDDSLAEGYNDDREQSNNDEKYAQEASWENYVEFLDTIEIKAPEGVILDDAEEGKKHLVVMVIWTDGTSTWVPHEVVREKCPQKVIDFYMLHLRFKQTAP